MAVVEKMQKTASEKSGATKRGVMRGFQFAG